MTGRSAGALRGTGQRAPGHSRLPAAIIQLLPAVNDAIDEHHAGACIGCAGDRRDCPTLWLIASTLDLIIWCWRIEKETTQGPDGHLPTGRQPTLAGRRSPWL